MPCFSCFMQRARCELLRHREHGISHSRVRLQTGSAGFHGDDCSQSYTEFVSQVASSREFRGEAGSFVEKVLPFCTSDDAVAYVLLTVEGASTGVIFRFVRLADFMLIHERQPTSFLLHSIVLASTPNDENEVLLTLCSRIFLAAASSFSLRLLSFALVLTLATGEGPVIPIISSASRFRFCSGVSCQAELSPPFSGGALAPLLVLNPFALNFEGSIRAASPSCSGAIVIQSSRFGFPSSRGASDNAELVPSSE